jgi:hypothetical protein
METKKCACCLQVKELSLFSKARTTSDKLQSYCKMCACLKSKAFRQHNKDYDKKNYAKNRERHLGHSKKRREANPDSYSAYGKKYYQENKEKLKVKAVEYHKACPELRRARDAKRRASKVNATPQWADKEKIEVVYEYSKLCSQVLKQVFHVDHIVPLKGKTVCGLHVSANLQVLPAGVNIKKSNKSWPDMWETTV